MSFNKLEQAILNWIKDTYKDATLSKQINNAVLIDREYTGVGYFVSILVDKHINQLDKIQFPSNVINGPYIRSEGVEFDGGSILFIENGHIALLELYANGSRFDRDIEDFELLDF